MVGIAYAGPATLLCSASTLPCPCPHILFPCSFYRFIRKRTHPADMLRDKRVAVLGLGDTNYDKFW